MDQIITWQLTNTTSVDEVETLLIVLAANEILMIYADNCCHVKPKMKNVFGESTEIKLDIFHAIQRITHVMSKKHLLFSPC